MKIDDKTAYIIQCCISAHTLRCDNNLKSLLAQGRLDNNSLSIEMIAMAADMWNDIAKALEVSTIYSPIPRNQI